MNFVTISLVYFSEVFVEQLHRSDDDLPRTYIEHLQETGRICEREYINKPFFTGVETEVKPSASDPLFLR